MIIMYSVEHPIISQLRYPLLSLEWILFVIALELGVFFLIKYRKHFKILKKTQEFGYFLLFFCYGLMIFFYIISDFYCSEQFRFIFLNIGDISMITGALLFAFFLEKHRKYILKKYLFTILFLIITVIYIILNINRSNYTIIISLLIWASFTLFLLVHIIGLVYRMKHIENRIIEIIKFIPSMLLLLIGKALSLDSITKYYGLELRLLGDFLQILSLCLIFIFFYKHPSIFEFDWQKIIEDIYILNRNGASLFHKSFLNKSHILDDSLVSGAISSVNIMLKELTQSTEKGISIIRKKGMIIYLFTSQYIIGVLIAKDEMNPLIFYLKKLIIKIEMIYMNIFEYWNGRLKIFEPIEFIIDEIFPK